MTEEYAKQAKLKQEFPRITEITLLSKGGYRYAWVCTTFMKCVVGCHVWSRRAFKEVLSEFITESDESFMLLTLENNYSRWVQEAIFVANGDGEKPKLPDSLYTNSGYSRVKGKGTSRRFHGWSKQGYLRFNELYCQVKTDRNSRAQFELEVLESCRETHSGDYGEDGTDNSDDEEIIPANDMVGVKQPVMHVDKHQKEKN